jgi:hypothetical protein
MTYRSKITVTAALLLVLGGLGAADAYLSEEDLTAQLPMAPAGLEMPQNPETTTPGVGVAKKKAAPVGDTLAALGFSVQPSQDQSMLAQIVGTEMPVESLAILKDGDRIGALIYVETGNAKTYFLSLKEALLAAFSPQVQDLQDETKIEPGTPIRNQLTFLDPSLSEERLTFVRIGDRFMEFHTATDKEAEMQTAIDGLSKL